MGGGWAREGMERDHLPITLPVLEKMGLAATDNVLDVGCGSEAGRTPGCAGYDWRYL